MLIFIDADLPKIQFIKSSLEEGAIGKPLTVSIRHFRQPEASDYGQPLPWRLQLSRRRKSIRYPGSRAGLFELLFRALDTHDRARTQ